MVLSFSRLKQAKKKSGQGAEGFSATDQWAWENFQFLVPHIVETERRNVVSFKSKLNLNTDSSAPGETPVVSQSCSEAEDDTRASTPNLSGPSKELSGGQDETATLGE